MIDWLVHSKTGNFYKSAGRVSKNAISSAFRAVRLAAADPSINIFHHIHERHQQALWSAISFFYDREPSFLELPPNERREQVCGFILLVEYKNHIAVFKSGIDLPASFRSAHLRAVGPENVEAATARVDATFEQIRLRNMTISKHAMRAKVLEADDLRSVLSPSGSSRYVPSGFRTRDSSMHFSATPRTGRIATKSERVSHTELITWSTNVIDRLTQKGVTLSPFIRNFARPMDLAAFPRHVKPVAVAIDVAAISDALFEEPVRLRLGRKNPNGFVLLSERETKDLVEALSGNFEVRESRGEFRVFDTGGIKHIGEIRIGKTRISLRRFELVIMQDVFIQELDTPGESEALEPLRRYIDRSEWFTVLFSEIDIVYLGGSLYRDPSLKDGGEALLGYLHENQRLTATVSEKGSFSTAHKRFDDDSVFSVVVNSLAAKDEVLACDDLGDEWADFVGINVSAQPNTLTFYHAKHGDLSLSASAFHVSVGQAIKNLQHVRLTADAVNSKRNKWERTYINDGQQTQIHRMIRGVFAAFVDCARDTAVSPDTIRRVVIVTDSLSRKAVEDVLSAAKKGERPPGHFVQLYSLLMGFFSGMYGGGGISGDLL